MDRPMTKPPMKTWLVNTEGGFYVYQSEPHWNNGRWAWDKQVVFIDEKTLAKLNKVFKQ